MKIKQEDFSPFKIIKHIIKQITKELSSSSWEKVLYIICIWKEVCLEGLMWTSEVQEHRAPIMPLDKKG